MKHTPLTPLVLNLGYSGLTTPTARTKVLDMVVLRHTMELINTILKDTHFLQLKLNIQMRDVDTRNARLDTTVAEDSSIVELLARQIRYKASSSYNTPSPQDIVDLIFQDTLKKKHIREITDDPMTTATIQAIHEWFHRDD